MAAARRMAVSRRSLLADENRSLRGESRTLPRRTERARGLAFRRPGLASRPGHAVVRAGICLCSPFKQIIMNIGRLSPMLLLLVLAAPVRAQDAGPGVMLEELAALSEAAYAHDADPGRAVLAQRQTSQA